MIQAIIRRSSGCALRAARMAGISVSLATLVGLLVVSPAASAGSDRDTENWPQWRGPTGNGFAPAGSPPTEWAEGKNVKWKVKVPGEGFATPIVWEDKIFIQSAIVAGKAGDAPKAKTEAVKGAGQNPPGGPQRKQGGPGGMRAPAPPTEPYQFALMCLDRKTGSTVWQRVACEVIPHEGHHPTGSFAASSPVTDGSHVYAFFGSRGLFCYDMDGNLTWKQDFGQMRIKMGFGEGSSPALVGNLAIVQFDHEAGSFIVALDKLTGETVWKKTRDEGTSWSTPLVVMHDGKPQIVTAATQKIRCYDAASGDLLWECSGLGPNTIPSPVSGNGMVFATSGFQKFAMLAIRMGGSGDLSNSKSINWRLSKGTPYVPSPLLINDRIYFYSGNNAVLTCVDANSGETIIKASQLAGFGLQGIYASPVGTDDHVYLVSQNGVTLVLKRSDELDVVATNRLDDRFDASPAIAGNEIFLRGHDSLYCIAKP